MMRRVMLVAGAAVLILFGPAGAAPPGLCLRVQKAADGGQGCVESAEGVGWSELDSGDKNGGGAESFELGGEIGGLVACSGDEDADVGQVGHPDFYCRRMG